MSQTNAPQPDTAPGAPAEIFDSTIVPANGQVSQDQLPGPDNREAPVHTGQSNGIDPYFFMQFMALASFRWDISMSPGQLIWSTPIHPTFCHQFLAHLSKMYNAFAGGIDFALTIAGTGFHCGKLIIVRLPPNVKPESLLTVSDITAFPYYVLDPKTLETVVKSAMDQRNVLYHYLPYDANNKQTFGGYIAVYVLLPLNTSSTGATQISVQVLSRPAPNFTFTQIVPIKRDVVNLWQPDDLIAALNMREDKTHALFLTNITGMTVYTAKEVRLLDYQTLNCVKLDRTPMNGVLQHRMDKEPTFTPKRFLPDKFVTHRLEIKADTEATYKFFWVQGTNANKIGVFSFEGIKVDEDPTKVDTIPQFLCEDVTVTWRGTTEKVPSGATFSTTGVLRLKGPDEIDPDDFKYLFRSEVEPHIASLVEGTDTIDADFFDSLMKKEQIKDIRFTFNKPVTYDMNYTEYSPPIEESLLLFNTEAGNCAQPWEVREAILQRDYSNILRAKDSMVFELIDSMVELPLIPIRLHYNGYFSTLAVTTNTIYKFTDPRRYYLRYVGTIPETTPMVGGRLPTQDASKYRTNCVLSSLYK